MTNLEERILSAIDRSGDCWLWTQGQNGAGYGKTTVAGQDWLTHRLVYTMIRGTIPDGMVLDHLCRVPLCCNPWHLEVVTKRDNALRGLPSYALTGRCLSGLHTIESEADYYVSPSGRRSCRQCRLAQSRKTNARRKRDGYKQKR